MQNKNMILDSLYAAADAVYRDFNSKLVPTVDKDKIIGVRTPVLCAMARDMAKSGVYKDFVQDLPHKYFEENQLHAFIISQYNDFDSAVRAVDGSTGVAAAPNQSAASVMRVKIRFM